MKKLIYSILALGNFGGLVLGIYWFGLWFVVPYVLIIFGVAGKGLLEKEN